MELLFRDRPTISNDDFAPVIQVLTWLLIGLTILSVGLRFTTKFIVARMLGIDDLFTFIALVQFHYEID